VTGVAVSMARTSNEDLSSDADGKRIVAPQPGIVPSREQP
jgi:hypothetical protein